MIIARHLKIQKLTLCCGWEALDADESVPPGPMGSSIERARSSLELLENRLGVEDSFSSGTTVIVSVSPSIKLSGKGVTFPEKKKMCD